MHRSKPKSLKMKKAILLISLTLFVSLISISQKAQITLSFLGEDINTSDYIPLTSVYIKNLTVGCDTTLYGEVPSLVIELSAGIEEQEILTFNINRIFPNPFNNSTFLELEVDEKGDFLIENKVIVELKAVSEIQDIFKAQILSYMKLSSVATGLLINFNVKLLKNGIHRFEL